MALDFNRRLSAPRPHLDRLHYIGALLGVLVVAHLLIMVGRGFDRGCFGFDEPTAFVECEIVTQSDAGSLLGVSNAAWGLVFYLLLGVLGWILGTHGDRRHAMLRRLRAALLTGGMVYTAWLVYVQATQLGAYCKLCLISAGIVTALFALVVAELFTEPSSIEQS